MNATTIRLPNGEEKTIQLDQFQALDGWDIQNKFIDFAASTDRALRREFTLEVLAYAQVIVDDILVPLKTDALIDNHLQTWQNVQAVFEAVLLLNGIDPKTHAEKPNYWDKAGADMAVSFIAEAAKLMSPSLIAFDKSFQGKPDV